MFEFYTFRDTWRLLLGKRGIYRTKHTHLSLWGFVALSFALISLNFVSLKQIASLCWLYLGFISVLPASIHGCSLNSVSGEPPFYSGESWWSRLILFYFYIHVCIYVCISVYVSCWVCDVCSVLCAGGGAVVRPPYNRFATGSFRLVLRNFVQLLIWCA